MSDENQTTQATSDDPTQGPDKDFLATVVKAIVGSPDDVIIQRSVDDLGVLLTLQVNQDDMPKVVGKGGQTAKALRTLLRLVGSKFDLRVNLKILEADGSERRSDDKQTESPATTLSTPATTEPKPETPENAVEKPTEKSDKKEETSGEAFENVI